MPLDDLAGRIERRVKRMLTDLAENLAADIRAQLAAPGRSGRVTGAGGRLHQASAPGEPPASDTGALAASIEAEDGDGTDAAVAAGAPYARALELGTARVAARPFLRPALDAFRGEVKPALLDAVRDELSKEN